jgi:signal transduction histidine kinase
MRTLSRDLRPSPLPLLLGLEWTLLSIAALVQILVVVAKPDANVPILNGVVLGLFAAMGLVFPQQQWHRFLYTALEFGLLLWLTFWGEFPIPSLLYIVLVIRNCVLLVSQQQVRSAVTILAFLICFLVQTYRLWHGLLPLQISFAQIGPVWVGFLIVFGLVFLFLQLLIDAMLVERQRQEQLVAANAQLREYALKVEKLSAVQERNRIARDIHDSLGHSLTVFNIHVEAALRLLRSDPAEVETLLLEVKQLGAKALQDVRQSVSMLRSDPLQGLSLSAAILSLVTNFQRTTGVVPTCTINVNQPLSSQFSFTLYCLAQEGLTNICKHAQATEVEISVQQIANEIWLIIRDNGKGFDRRQHSSGFGLQGMSERVLALAGELTIDTSPGRGCRIQAVFPVQAP